MAQFRVHQFVLGGLLLLGASGPSRGFVFADTPPNTTPESVNLEQLTQNALECSPALQAKKRAYEAAKARAVVAWLPEDPMFGIDVEGQSDLFQFNSRTDREYMVSQTIPFPTTLVLRGQLALRDAQMAFQRYKEEERQVVWHIEQPYYELLLAQKTVAALEEVRALAQKLVTAARARYESNQAPQQDLLKAQIELSKVGVEIFNWNEKAHLAEAHFSHILNRPLHTQYAIVEPAPNALPTRSRDELEQLALRNRPELKAWELGIRRAKTSRLLATTRWLPDLTGRIEMRQFKGEGGIRENDTFLGVTVPVWSLLKGFGGEWRGAGKDVEEAEALYGEMKNEVLLAVHEAYSKVQAADNAVRSYETFILPQARQQVDVALASYEGGRTDFLSLLDAQRTLRDTQIAYYAMKADYEMGLSNLRLAVGGPLVSSSGQ